MRTGRMGFDRTTELDRFAAARMKLVRDRSIDVVDRQASGGTVGRAEQRWQAVLEPGGRGAVRKLAPDIVDQVLFALLDAADNQLPLGWRCADRTWIALDELGWGETAVGSA